MPKYYNEITREIIDYPEEAAALFPVLKPVPSERSRAKEDSADKESEPASKTPTKRNGEVNAK